MCHCICFECQWFESQKIFPSVIKLFFFSFQKQLVHKLYPLSAVAQGIIGNEEILDHNGVQGNVKHVCPHEPYISFALLVIHVLFSNSKANVVIPRRFLKHIQELAPSSIMSPYNTSKVSTYSELISPVISMTVAFLLGKILWYVTVLY